MFEKSIEVITSKVSSLQEQLLIQERALEVAKADRQSMAEKVDALIRDVHNNYGVDGLSDVINAIASFISKQEGSTVAEVTAPALVETKVEALVTPEVEKEAVPEVEVEKEAKATATKRKGAGKAKKLVQSTIFDTLVPEKEPESDAVITATEVAHVTESAPVTPTNWINFDQDEWLKEREGKYSDELDCLHEERITNFLREGWSFSEIPLKYGTFREGDSLVQISPENPDPCNRLSLVFSVSSESMSKVFNYDYLTQLERNIIDKMFAIAYGEELPSWRKVLHIMERLTGLTFTSEAAIEKMGILSSIGIMKSLAHCIVGMTYVDENGRKARVKSNEWKEYLVKNADMSPDELAYLEVL